MRTSLLLFAVLSLVGCSPKWAGRYEVAHPPGARGFALEIVDGDEGREVTFLDGDRPVAATDVRDDVSEYVLEASFVLPEPTPVTIHAAIPGFVSSPAATRPPTREASKPLSRFTIALFHPDDPRRANLDAAVPGAFAVYVESPEGDLPGPGYLRRVD